MKVIRYWTSHPIKDPRVWMDNFELALNEFDFVYDDKEPEYLIATEHIYTVKESWEAFLFYFKKAQIKIMYGGECVFPDMNLFDYAVCFDRGIGLSERIIRRPCVSFFKKHIFRPLDLACTNPVDELQKKSGFCCFIYSNPKAHPRRDELFHLLSTYKKVDSLGAHLRNCDCVPSRSRQDWRELAVQMKSRYKFSIASENACYTGYVSEKIISSFCGYSIPIYWGDPDIEEEFNPKSFINANKCSDRELIDAVMALDGDDSLYLDMLSQPPMTYDQKCKSDQSAMAYSCFWRKIFSEESRKMICAPRGTWTDMYIDSLYKRNKMVLQIQKDKLKIAERIVYKIYKKCHKYLSRRFK